MNIKHYQELMKHSMRQIQSMHNIVLQSFDESDYEEPLSIIETLLVRVHFYQAALLEWSQSDRLKTNALQSMYLFKSMQEFHIETKKTHDLITKVATKNTAH